MSFRCEPLESFIEICRDISIACMSSLSGCLKPLPAHRYGLIGEVVRCCRMVDDLPGIPLLGTARMQV